MVACGPLRNYWRSGFQGLDIEDPSLRSYGKLDGILVRSIWPLVLVALQSRDHQVYKPGSRWVDEGQQRMR